MRCPGCKSYTDHHIVWDLTTFIRLLFNLTIYPLFMIPLAWVFDDIVPIRPMPAKHKCRRCGMVFVGAKKRGRNLAECPRCEYDLTGNTSGRCPECGRRLSRSQRNHLRKRQTAPPKNPAA